MGTKTRDEDFVEHLFIASTHDTMLFFTEKGRCFWLRVYEIPEGEKTSKGRAVQNLIQIPPDDKVKAIIEVRKLDDKDYVQNHFIILCTKRGIIKKTCLEDFSRPRVSGVNAITINEGDELLAARLTDGNNEVMMAVKSGRAIRFPEEKVRPTGRGAIGVAGIEVDNENDEVVGLVCVHKDDKERTILVVSQQGFGKRTAIEEYRITNRGGKGVKTINVTEKTGGLVGIMDVKEKEDLIITCKSGVTIRTRITDIREAGRATQGVTLIRLDEGDEIAATSKIEEQDESAADLEEGTEPTATADGAENTETTEATDNPETPVVE
jgi:DNA gyrase subunit A